MRACAVAAFLFAVAPLSASAPPPFRLGDEVQPKHYRVHLTLTPGQDTFRGEVDIDVTVRSRTDEIWLNAAGIDVQRAELRTGAETIAGRADTSVPGFAGIVFPNQIAPGDAQLHLNYTGHISSHSSAGIFQLKEADRWYLYTQFEPTDARRAFPCFDEPSFKTAWEISLNIPKEQRAFANTPSISESTEAGGRKLVKFAPTRPLPSYLVAFAAGPFDVVDAGSAGMKHVPVRVITPHGKAAQAKYAAAAIPDLLSLLEKYFGMPYPYEKLDSIAMPISNFAMENAGLITYGSGTLLANPKDDTLTRQREFAVVAAHEMAHQWFGDLVTTAWWNDIWLNEGFATWMETKIVSEWKPDWHVDVSAVEDRLQAMQLDSLVSARKIRQPILSESDIANAFDDITYKKGAAVLRMFEHWIGPEVFRRGVQLYLTEHADGNATTQDFLAAISTAAHKDIAPAFDTFLDQPGVPLVTAKLDCSNRSASVRLSQNRYLPLGSPGRAAENEHPSRWQIPVCVRYASGTGAATECTLFTSASMQMSLANARSCPAWITANADGNGYYHAAGFDPGSSAAYLTTPELVSTLGDVAANVEGGNLAPSAALALIPRFASDPRRHVVTSDIDIARLTEANYVPANTWREAAVFIDQVFGTRARELGWAPRPRDNDDTRLLRHSLVPFAAGAGADKELISEAQSLARKWLTNHNAIQMGMLADVLETAAQYGDRGLFDKLHAAALASHDRHERRALLNALGSFRDPAIARSALDLLLTTEFDAREAFRPLLFGPLAYPETRDLPFDFVRKNLDTLLTHLPREVGGDFAADLPQIGDSFCSAAQRRELYSFFQDRVSTYVGGARNLAHTLEHIDICIAQRHVIAPEIERYLNSTQAFRRNRLGAGAWAGRE